MLVSLILGVLAGSDVRAVAAPHSPDWDPEFVVRADGRSSYRVVLYDRAKFGYEAAVETEHWVVYVPRGFRIDTTLPVGTRIGTSYGNGRIGSLGDVVVADPTVGSTRRCLQGSHDTFWRLPTDTPNSPGAEVLVAVDRIVGGENARLAAYRLTVCPPRTAGDSELDIQLDVIMSPTSNGDYLWRAVFYPTSYTGAAVPQPVEARSLVRLPIRVALSAKRFTALVGTKRTRERKVLIKGLVTENGKPPVQGRDADREGRYGVSLYRQTTKNGPDQYLGDLGVASSGRFQAVVRDRRGSYYRVTTIDSGAPNGRQAPTTLCARPWLAPGGCVRPNLWEFFVDSPVVRAR